MFSPTKCQLITRPRERTIQEIEADAQRFHVRRQIDDAEAARRAILNAKPSPGDQRLFTPTQCKVLKSFCVAGKPVQVGSVVTLEYHDAVSLQALNKVELL
jgi:hypothetical protein